MSRCLDVSNPWKHFIVLGGIGLLAACGSGSGSESGNTEPPAEFSLTDIIASDVVPGSLQFAWQASEYAERYQVCRKLIDASDSCEAIGASTLATDQTLSSHEIQAIKGGNYFIRATNDEGFTDSDEMKLDIAQLIVASRHLTSSDSDLKNTYGQSVSLSRDGKTLAVGAPMEDEGDSFDLQDRGAVYVYHRLDDGTWSEPVVLKSSNIGGWDWFGASLSLSDDGNVLAIGATGESSNSVENPDIDMVDAAGAVYVFQRDTDGLWQQQSYLKAAQDIDMADHFGKSVELSGDGNSLAVGVPDEDSDNAGNPLDNSLEGSGAVYVFHRQADDSWGESQFLKSRFPDQDGNFGRMLAFSEDGMILAVGEPNEGTNASGAVYIYEKGQDGLWQSSTRLVANDEPRYGSFGISLGMSSAGDVLAVGSDGHVGWTQGSVTIFSRSAETTWNEVAVLSVDEGNERDRFGSSLALSHDAGLLAVGAIGESSGSRIDQADTSSENAGAVYLFRNLGGGNWSTPDYLKAKDIQTDSFYGKRISLSGDGTTLAVGADGVTDSNENSNYNISNMTGSVFIY